VVFDMEDSDGTICRDDSVLLVSDEVTSQECGGLFELSASTASHISTPLKFFV